ncbi:MAG: NADH-quinone oxidoreductase subunit N [Proteobacteria bacterium]|nr:NADH-quinone oxidoreductase subunit N [Pseudomonadota bacterium]
MSWVLLAPELWFTLAVAVFLFLAMAGRPQPRRDRLAALALAAAGVGVCLLSVGAEGLTFAEAYRVDLFSQTVKILLAGGVFAVIAVSGKVAAIAPEDHAEYYLLLFLSTLAMMLLVSGTHLLLLYVSLELSSYSLYILVSLRRGGPGRMPSGLHFFLVGICASAITLFGMALVYGATGSGELSELHRALTSAASPLARAGVWLLLGGFLFKLAAFPFHVWAPDAYEGAANEVAAYVATVSKAGAVAVLVRLAAALGAGGGGLTAVLITLSVVSMTLGNLAAMAQRDLKRLFAYSAIAHAGYALLGILNLDGPGYAGALYYAVALLVMNFTAFFVVVQVARDGRNLQIADLAGLHRRAPALALALFAALYSLAGLPPTIGFSGKFLVFVASMERGYFPLVLVAMINVAISLYYYLMVLKAAYLDEAEDPAVLSISWPAKALAGMLTVLIVAGGIFPRPLWDLASRAAQSLLGSLL